MELKTKLPYMCDKCHKPLPKEHWRITENYGGYGSSTTKKWDLCDTCYKMLCDFINDKRMLTQEEILNLFPIYEERSENSK